MLHTRRLIPRVLFSSSLLAIAATLPALATVTLSDSTGTSVTLNNDGTIAFTCKGSTHLTSGNEKYVICVNSAPSGAITPGSTTPSGSISVAFNQTVTVSAISTTLSGKLGIQTFLTWRGGTCTFDVTQKIFNKSGDIIKLTHYKRLANVNVDGDTNNLFAGGANSLEVLASKIHTVILTGGGNTGATQARAYHNQISNFGAEQTSCLEVPPLPAPPATGLPNASRASTTTPSDRLLGVRYTFTPGFVGLKPAGQSGSEKFFSVRYTVQ